MDKIHYKISNQANYHFVMNHIFIIQKRCVYLWSWSLGCGWCSIDHAILSGEEISSDILQEIKQNQVNVIDNQVTYSDHVYLFDLWDIIMMLNHFLPSVIKGGSEIFYVLLLWDHTEMLRNTLHKEN